MDSSSLVFFSFLLFVDLCLLDCLAKIAILCPLSKMTLFNIFQTFVFTVFGFQSLWENEKSFRSGSANQRAAFWFDLIKSRNSDKNFHTFIFCPQMTFGIIFMVRRGHSTLNLRLRDVYFVNLRLIKPEYGAKFFLLQPDEKLQVCQNFLTIGKLTSQSVQGTPPLIYASYILFVKIFSVQIRSDYF